jgi:hypothetical protein
VLQGDVIEFAEHQGSGGCRGTWIAGQVIGLGGEPLSGLPILITGEDYQAIQVSGTAADYGLAGYEFRVANSNIEAEFEVKLVSATTGTDLSGPIIVRTRGTCEESVALVTFVQVRPLDQ